MCDMRTNNASVKSIDLTKLIMFVTQGPHNVYIYSTAIFSVNMMLQRQCCFNFFDAGPTLEQHCLNVSCLPRSVHG